MPDELTLLIGRETPCARTVYESHAKRLRERLSTGRVRVETYDREPDSSFRERLAGLDADRIYAVPMCVGESYDTTEGIPAALHAVSGSVRYCDRPGRSERLAGAVLDRARREVDPGPDASLVLVGLGSEASDSDRKSVEYQAEVLRDRSAYGEVKTCYLMCNPAVECVRYSVTNERAVAVPMFLTRTDATERHIPDALEIERGGIEYARPVGDHPRVTDAIHAEIERQRALAASDVPADSPGRRPVATDGDGRGG